MSFHNDRRAAARRRAARSNTTLGAPGLLPLEPRVMLSATGKEHDDPIAELCISSPPVVASGSLQQSLTLAGDGTALAGLPLGSIPALHSLATAKAKLYLDFDGDTTSNWSGYNPGTTPAYDQDGDPSTFSGGELASIQEIWARISEKYSAFNIDVTTVNPGSLTDKVAQRIVFGGSGAWLGSVAGGVSYVGSFANSTPNTSWVFTVNMVNGDPHYSSEAGAHEAGHAFGLQHQSTWSGNMITNEYNPGDGAVAPTMGVSYYSARGLWYYGTNDLSSTTMQDDMAVIAGTANGFGYRPDDYGNSIGAAGSLTVSGNSLMGSGVVEKTLDSDFFSFNTGAGNVTLTASTATGATLDLKLGLYSSGGSLIALADTSNLGESFSADLPAGTYYVSVASHGSYGDVGQYTLAVTVPSLGDTLAAPSSLSAAAISTTQVNVNWQDNSSNEDGFQVQRSTDGGVNWGNLALLGSDATSYQDLTTSAGGAYSYRVYGYNSATTSAMSNIASAVMAPTAPSALAATAVSSSQINLSWADTFGETSYEIDRSLDGSTWAAIGTASADATSFPNTALASSTTYFYRVIAINGGGTSAPSDFVWATTLVSVPLPAAPSSLVATSVSGLTIRVTWQDNSTNESGFYIDQSTNGKAWQRWGSVSAGTTSVDITGRKNTTYYFRVSSYNSAGQSGLSNVASATTAGTAAAKGNMASAEVLGSLPGSASEAGIVFGSNVDDLIFQSADLLN